MFGGLGLKEYLFGEHSKSLLSMGVSSHLAPLGMAFEMVLDVSAAPVSLGSDKLG